MSPLYTKAAYKKVRKSFRIRPGEIWVAKSVIYTAPPPTSWARCKAAEPGDVLLIVKRCRSMFTNENRVYYLRYEPEFKSVIDHTSTPEEILSGCKKLQFHGRGRALFIAALLAGTQEHRNWRHDDGIPL